jgi:hypothetical protein
MDPDTGHRTPCLWRSPVAKYLRHGLIGVNEVRYVNGDRPIVAIARVVTAHPARYNSNMTAEQFTATLHQFPFRPFTIHMVDGRKFEVPHRDFVARSKSGRTVIVFQSGEDYSVLDLLLMSELEVHSANGRPA